MATYKIRAFRARVIDFEVTVKANNEEEAIKKAERSKKYQKMVRVDNGSCFAHGIDGVTLVNK